MTQLEKTIYNQWLVVSRAVDSKPFKVRQNFDKFEDNNFIISYDEGYSIE